MAAGSATWFIGLQVFEIKSFCLYCMGVHLCSLLICGLNILLLRSSSQQFASEHTIDLLGIGTATEATDQQGSIRNQIYPILASCVASLGMLTLVVGQVFFGPPQIVYEELAEVPADFEEANDAQEEVAVAPPQEVVVEEPAEDANSQLEPVVTAGEETEKAAGTLETEEAAPRNRSNSKRGF